MKPNPPLIDADSLLQQLSLVPAPIVLDCSFDLAAPGASQQAFDAGHVPGAFYAHLDRDLSAPHDAAGPIKGGRHPLPSREAFALQVARWGIRPGRSVVTYDNQGGPYAARAWWMLRWLGHGAVAVLDGGLAAWRAAGGSLQTASGPLDADGAAYPLGEPGMPVVQAADLLARPGMLAVIDARAAERFRGDVEPLDSRAGHIPGARNRFFKLNLQADGRFQPADQLRRAFDAFGLDSRQVVHQCGSGVTACHNLLAMEQAGLHGSALYPGSWSEWSADPSRPIATG